MTITLGDDLSLSPTVIILNNLRDDYKMRDDNVYEIITP